MVIDISLRLWKKKQRLFHDERLFNDFFRPVLRTPFYLPAADSMLRRDSSAN